MTIQYGFKALSAVPGVTFTLAALPLVALANGGADPANHAMKAGVVSDQGLLMIGVGVNISKTRNVKEKSNVAE